MASSVARYDRVLMKLLLNSSFSALTRAGIRSSGTRAASTWRTRLPNAIRPVDGASAKSMKTRGPRLNAPMLRPGSLATTPRMANVVSPIVIDLHRNAQRREQLGSHDCTVALERMRVRLPAGVIVP